jgi:hypothetical protein
MFHRVSAILAVLMTVVGLSASAAFAAANQSSAASGTSTASSTSPPYFLVENDNGLYGITYTGPGNQATITDRYGQSHFIYLGNQIVAIANSNGNCLRMRDASQSYAVMEENGCNTGDLAEQFLKNCTTTGTPEICTFLNEEQGQYLGESCPAHDGNKVWGESGATGTCFKWQKFSA